MIYFVFIFVIVIISIYFLFVNTKKICPRILLENYINYLKKAYRFFNEKENYRIVNNYLNQVDEDERKNIVIIEDLADRCYELKNLKGSLILYQKTIDLKKKFEPKNNISINETINKVKKVIIEKDRYEKKLYFY
jgi:hypothetical protein